MTIPTISHAPARVDHTDLTAGEPWQIGWQLLSTPGGTPLNLAGKTVRVIAAGSDRTDLARSDSTGQVTWMPTAQTTAALTRSTLTATLLIDGEVRAWSQLRIARWITP